MYAELAYLFRHALYRDAAYQLQPPLERAALHRFALEIMLELLKNPALADLRGALAEEVANHARAARDGQTGEAYLCRIEAEQLLLAGTFSEARYHFEHAVDLAHRALALGDLPPGLRMHLHQLAAECLGVLGRFDQSLHEFSGLRTEALLSGDELAAAKCLVGESIALFRGGRFAESELAARKALEEGQNRNSLSLQARAWQCLGKVFDHTQGAAQALAATEKSLEMHIRAEGEARAEGVKIDLALRLAAVGRRSESAAVLAELRASPGISGSLPRLARVLSTEASNAAESGELARSLELLAESTAAARRIGACDIIGNNEMALGMYVGNAGRHEEAMAAYARAELIYRESGTLSGLSSLHNNRASLLVAMGRLDDAESEMAAADTLNAQLKRPLGLAIGMMNRAELALCRSEAGHAATLFEGAAAQFEVLGRPTLVAHALAQAAHARLEEGQPATALVLARKSDEILARSEAPPETVVDARLALVLSLAASGKQKQARTLAAKLLHSTEFAALSAKLRDEVETELAALT